MTHKVLVSDKLSESGLAPLRQAGDIEIDVRTDLSPDELVQAIPDYDALLVRSATTVTGDVIRAGTRLRVVGRAGVGVDNIDIAAATQAGVVVVNAPTGNVVAAAEHTVALLMALARNVAQADAHVRSGQWQRSQFIGVELRDKVLGTVGLGRVAQEVVKRAQGLGMTVVAYDPYVAADYAAQRGVRLADLPTLLREVDFLTLHVPLTESTRGLIGRDELASMKHGAFVINVSRGGVVEETALVEAIESGHIGGAALDVFAQEPLPAENPLRTSDKIILTPHLGGSTVEAQEQVAVDVAVQVVDVLNNRPARYAINAPMIPPRDLEFLAPYIDLAERMGRFVEQLGVQGVSNVEITAHGRLANFDLDYLKAGIIQGLLANAVEVRINLVNAGLVAEERGLRVIERKKQQNGRFDSMLTLRASSGEAGADTWTVRGTVLNGEPQIVAINDLWVEFPAYGNLLLTSHRDQPGIIGRVGMHLGEADVNISFMHVGRYAPREGAIMVLGIDEPVAAAMLNDICTIPGVDWAKAVAL